MLCTGLASFNICFAEAGVQDEKAEFNSLMVGFSLGYGDTDWSQISNQEDPIVQATAPTHAEDGGAAYGAWVAYQFSPRFLLEAAFTRYPNTTVYFNTDRSIYDFESMLSKTETYTFTGQFIVPLLKTNIYAFADAGAALTHRYDRIAAAWKWGPSFGIGLEYDFNSRFMSEIGFQYSTGYGEATAKPVEDYVPFTYFVYLSIGVRLFHF